RSTRLISGPQGPQVLLDGRPVVLLCSNNYLGFADHPRVREAAAEAALRWGAGAGASRLVSGTMTIHDQLEHALAEFERSESCVLFGSGYLANIGVLGALTALPGGGAAARERVVFSDALNHASIVDGCRLARAETFVYQHGDLDHLAWGLRGAPPGSVVVTDSVFSMDGDIAPLAEIVELAKRHRARVVVDEAHATGVLGPGGRGAVAAAGLDGEVDVVVGTLSKALGAYGAYACASAEIVDLLVNKARTLIFSTAPPPPAIAAALAALELLIEQPRRVEKLAANAELMRSSLAAAGLRVRDGDTPIVPLVVGGAAAAIALSEAVLARGAFAQAIRPPTVPDGSSRLRLTVMASHSAAEIERAAAAIADAAAAIGARVAAVEREQPPAVGRAA
ncbi:MAG TPA: 8-amino-7-oxononanoate synthase, partial [Solirubrobacteraceae bacterium]|nr:8-amino-7-oxononanoate synthase [Solirubrobacteraceae bacterium]